MISIVNVFFDDFIPNWRNQLTHVECHIAVLVIEGRLLYELNGVKQMASKGDMLMIPAGTRRSSQNDGDRLHQKIAIGFHYEGGSGLSMVDTPTPIIMRPKSFEYMKERFLTMYRHALERDLYYEQICKGILLEILGLASRDLEALPFIRRKQQHVHQMETYIVDHYREKIALAELAGLIRRSPNYAASLFKEIKGMSPIEFQHRLRITTAMEMLQNTNISIHALAEHLGYYDSSSFYKMFTKFTGVAPSSYVRTR